MDAVGARAVGDVVIDGHREGVRLLEDHADALAQDVDVHLVLVDVHAVELDVAGDAAALDEVVHAVQAFQKRGFAAAGRTDERGDLLFRDVDIDIFQRMEAAIVQVHIAHFKFVHEMTSHFYLCSVPCVGRGRACAVPGKGLPDGRFPERSRPLPTWHP